MKLFESSSKEKLTHKVVAFGAFIGVVLINSLATILPLNGMSTGEISDSYPNLFAPAGVTFSIWGVIYLLLAVYVVYQFAVIRGDASKIKEPLLEKLNTYFIASSILNMIWIFTWHYKVMWLSVLIIIGMLYTLIRCNLLLQNIAMTAQDRWAIKAPFSVYFGWLTVATVANITTWLVSIEWDGFGLRGGIWMVAILLVTAVIALATIYKLRDWLYGAVIIWALAGILLKHLSTNGWNGTYPSVIVTLTILLSVFIVVVLYYARKEYERS
jgi:hypothetical protein